MTNILNTQVNQRFVQFFLVVLIIFHSLAGALGKVYLVLGSDTAIWDGMSVSRYENTYNLSLYTDPARNAYQVMDPAFRQQFVDSFGQPVKLTWWMMGGNIFRYATNRNIPLANTMTLYLMQKYHGANVQANGDELSLHYHTFKWTDYNQDGRYFWNQSLTFAECREDWNYTLATYLLEENVFPVSYRSGWHYMDNGWQAVINDLFPFSMHNDYPAVRTDTEEPLDNTFDWSLATSSFIPYQPSETNYQLPGGDRGWNLRSAHFWRVPNQNLMDTLFYQASQGIDQVACLWGHLPESDFLDNIALIDNLAHQAEDDYPGVEFRYCTAVEAMQLWLGTQDTIAPEILIAEESVGSEVRYTLTSNEPLFQPAPFVAVMDIYEQYHVFACTATGVNQWQTQETIDPGIVAKVSVAAIDTAGNLTTEFLHYRADDIYLDDESDGFSVITGTWSTTSDAAWGVETQVAHLGFGETARARWTPEIVQTGLYNLFVQVPDAGTNYAAPVYIVHTAANDDTVRLTNYPIFNDWLYLGTSGFTAGTDDYVELFGTGTDQTGTQNLVADVVRFSALVRDRDINISNELLDFGPISAGDTAEAILNIQNLGLNDLTISAITASSPAIIIDAVFPLQISGMSFDTICIQVFTEELGLIVDTLVISSDDSHTPVYRLPLQAFVEPFFKIVDNEDDCCYSETGAWNYSVAQAWGGTSRYAYLGNGASARFTISLPYGGLYAIYEIVPTTVNSTDRAVYSVIVNGSVLDTIIINQNTSSGNWILLGEYNLLADQPVVVQVKDEGQNTTGPVIRADAVKFSLLQGVAVDEYQVGFPTDYRLDQNYPNPFNANTIISYNLPKKSRVTLNIYDITGRLVLNCIDDWQAAGIHQYNWDSKNIRGEKLSTGVYIYQLLVNAPNPGYHDSKKMLLIK